MTRFPSAFRPAVRTRLSVATVLLSTLCCACGGKNATPNALQCSPPTYVCAAVPYSGTCPAQDNVLSPHAVGCTATIKCPTSTEECSCTTLSFVPNDAGAEWVCSTK
jgi:hypothetical protein